MEKTELKIGVVGYGIYALLSQLGASPDTYKEAVSSFPDFLHKLGDDPITSAMFGIIVVVYTWCRTKRKNIKTMAEVKYPKSPGRIRNDQKE